MSLKELASLAPWNWDPQAAKHPPKKAALQDFEKIESAWRHDDTGQALAPAATPRERRRSSATCNLMEVGWETPSASGLARKAASADRARSLLKRKAAEIQTPETQKQPPPQQRPTRNQLRVRMQDADALQKAGASATASETTELPGQHRPIPQTHASEAADVNATPGAMNGSGGAVRDHTAITSCEAANDTAPSANQTPATMHLDMSMRPPRWTPAVGRGSGAPLESGTPRAPVPRIADNGRRSHGEGVATAAQLHLQGCMSAPVQLLADKCGWQLDKERVGSNGGQAAISAEKIAPCGLKMSTPFGDVPQSQIAVEPSAVVNGASDDVCNAAGSGTADHHGRPAPETTGRVSGGSEPCGDAAVAANGPCSQSRNDRSRMCIDARPVPFMIDAAENPENSTPSANQQDAHRRGNSRLLSDSGLVATALATRLSMDGRTPYKYGSVERHMLSPAYRNLPATRTMRLPPKLQLSMFSPNQPQPCRPSPSGSQRLRLPDHPTAACTDGSGSNAAPNAATTGHEEAADGVAARASPLKLASMTQDGISLPSAITEGVSLTQPQLQGSCITSLAGALRPTNWPNATPRQPGSAVQNDQDMARDAALLPSSSPTLKERQEPAVRYAGLHGAVQDAVAGTPREAPPPMTAKTMSPGKAVRSVRLTPGQHDVGAGTVPCVKQTSMLPRSPLAARSGSHVLASNVGTADFANKTTRKLGPNKWGFGLQGSAANRVQHTGLRENNQTAGAMAARDLTPRVVTSSTTGISGAACLGQRHGNSCEVLNKGTLQDTAATNTAYETHVPALEEAEIPPQGPKVSLPVGRVAASGNLQYFAVLPSTENRRRCDEEMTEAAHAGRVIEGKKTEELPPSRRQSLEVESESNTIVVDALQAAVDPVEVGMTTDEQHSQLDDGTLGAALRPSQVLGGIVGRLADGSITMPVSSAVASQGSPGAMVNVRKAVAAATGADAGAITATGLVCGEPALPPVTLTQQQLLVLDQLLAFFRATGCRHPSAMSAAELVAAISSFCQSVGIPVVASNIQTLASWLGTLLALEKPVKAYAQAQARARTAQQTQATCTGGQPQPLLLQQQRQQDRIDHQLVAVPRINAIELGSAALSLGREADGGAGTGTGEAGEAAGGKPPLSCISTPGGASPQAIQKRRVPDFATRAELELQHQGPQDQVQDARCQPYGVLQPQREEQQQQSQHHDGVKGTLCETTTAEVEGRSSGGSDRISEGKDSFLPILPLNLGKATAPTPLEVLSTEWSTNLSPAVATLYERLSTCQQVLRSALLSAAVGAAPAPQPSAQNAGSCRTQRQSSIGSTAELHAAAATLAMAGLPTVPAAGAVLTDQEAKPRAQPQQPSSYPQSAITQQLQRLLSRQQQQQLIGPVGPPKAGFSGARGDAGGAAETIITTPAAGRPWPAHTQATPSGAGPMARAQSRHATYEHQASAAMPDSFGPRMSSSSGGGGASGATAGFSAVNLQQDLRPGAQAELAASARHQATIGHSVTPPTAVVLSRESRSVQQHPIPTVTHVAAQPYMTASSSVMPGRSVPGWNTRQGHQQPWTGARGTAASGNAAGTAAPGPGVQHPHTSMQPPARPQVQIPPAAALNPTATATAAISGPAQWTGVGSDIAAAAAAPRLAQTSLVVYGAAAAAKGQLPSKAGSQVAAFPYHAYDVPGARALQFPPTASATTASATPGHYPRVSAISLAEDANVLQPSPVQPATATGHTAAAITYTHALRPYGYPSAPAGHAWHYANPYGWCTAYSAAGRAIPGTEPAETFAYSYKARGTAVPYMRGVAGAAGGNGAQGPASSATDGMGAAVSTQRGSGAPGLEATQQQQLMFATAKSGSRRAKPVGLGWNMHSYTPTAGQAYGHVSAGSYPGGLQGGPGWGGGS